MVYRVSTTYRTLIFGQVLKFRKVANVILLLVAGPKHPIIQVCHCLQEQILPQPGELNPGSQSTELLACEQSNRPLSRDFGTQRKLLIKKQATGIYESL